MGGPDARDECRGLFVVGRAKGLRGVGLCANSGRSVRVVCVLCGAVAPRRGVYPK